MLDLHSMIIVEPDGSLAELADRCMDAIEQHRLEGSQLLDALDYLDLLIEELRRRETYRAERVAEMKSAGRDEAEFL